MILAIYSTKNRRVCHQQSHSRLVVTVCQGLFCRHAGLRRWTSDSPCNGAVAAAAWPGWWWVDVYRGNLIYIMSHGGKTAKMMGIYIGDDGWLIFWGLSLPWLWPLDHTQDVHHHGASLQSVVQQRSFDSIAKCRISWEKAAAVRAGLGSCTLIWTDTTQMEEVLADSSTPPLKLPQGALTWK